MSCCGPPLHHDMFMLKNIKWGDNNIPKNRRTFVLTWPTDIPLHASRPWTINATCAFTIQGIDINTQWRYNVPCCPLLPTLPNVARQMRRTLGKNYVLGTLPVPLPPSTADKNSRLCTPLSRRCRCRPFVPPRTRCCKQSACSCPRASSKTRSSDHTTLACPNMSSLYRASVWYVGVFIRNIEGRCEKSEETEVVCE